MIRRLHKMVLPEKVIVGENILDRLHEVYDELENKKRILVVTGSNVYRKIGKKFERNWKTNQVVKIVFASSPTMGEVERIIGIVKETKTETVIGLGGGRVIDIAKMVAFKSGCEFISMPTSASHDGIASSFVSIREKNRAYSIPTKPPHAIIVDIDVICNAPPRLISSGVGDAIAKITAVKDWKLAHKRTGEYYGEYAAQLALMGAELVIKNAEGIGSRDKESIRTLVEALISDGVAAGIAGSSRPCSGSEHLFSHALDIYSTQHALHGEQCGVGTIMMAYLHNIDYLTIKEALKKANAPTNAKELGISKENIIKALKKAKTIRPDRYTILNEVSLSERDYWMLAKETEVI